MTESVVVSIVTCNGERFIKDCLECVFSQTRQATEVYVFDNASTDGTAELVARQFSTVKLISSDVNIGFGAGHNRVIARTQSSFVLVVNQDAFLEPSFLEELMTAVRLQGRVGIAGGKLFSCRTNQSEVKGEPTIDMTWLDIEKKRRQVCYASGQPDRDNVASPMLAFAMDGAVMLLRRAMLDDIGIDGEYFDEDFFAGKEDLDISWRAQLCGWKCMYVPAARGRHVRTFTPADRREEVSQTLKCSSIRNRYLLMLKNDLIPHFARHFPHIAFYDLKIFAYILLYERSSLKAYSQIVRLAPKALRKRRLTMQRKRVDDNYILQWFR